MVAAVSIGFVPLVIYLLLLSAAVFTALLTKDEGRREAALRLAEILTGPAKKSKPKRKALKSSPAKDGVT